jgi:putative flavoprotein involved in K+ transport
VSEVLDAGVVGAGQSGLGASYYLQKAGRVARRYRRRDILEWWVDMQFWETTYASLEDKSASRNPLPQVSGVGRRGHSVSLQDLAHRGAVILGRLIDVEGDTLILGNDAAAHVRLADQASQRFKQAVDAYIEKTSRQLPPLVDDPADLPDPEAECASTLERLSLKDAQVGTIIWSTGFNGDFSWIHLPVFDSQGVPITSAASRP